MESNCALSAGVSDMLVQGWNDVVRIFRPCRSSGARSRSAICGPKAPSKSPPARAGQTVWVRIQATVPRALRLRDPFQGAEVRIAGAELKRDGESFTGQLARVKRLPSRSRRLRAPR